TDGVSERHADGRFFDDAGVERSLQGAPPDPAGVADRLLDDALAFVDRAPHDDMAVLVIAAG
ncbi:MAG TPA: SpoIIE family protein phosphatase, partial [Acidimicrobiales bacterium]|nr:SpoIIE family protein phosphatase [Acidimicrobiales bacterium]